MKSTWAKPGSFEQQWYLYDGIKNSYDPYG